MWRGPMVMSALDSFMTKVSWAPLDVLVIDMPPGTGQASMHVCEHHNRLHATSRYCCWLACSVGNGVLLFMHSVCNDHPRNVFSVGNGNCCPRTCVVISKARSLSCRSRISRRLPCPHHNAPTGDAQISIGQRLTLSGAVIISTPQVISQTASPLCPLYHQHFTSCHGPAAAAEIHLQYRQI